MPAGQITGKLNLNAAGWSSAVDKAKKEIKSLQDASKSMGHGTVSSMQAASASIRLIEGDMTRNVRAVERFITTIPGIGKALQAAFPIVGALATVGVLARIGEEVYKVAHDLGQIRNVANQSFTALTEGAQRNADALRVTNDKLEQQIAILEHKPVNNMALALDEARLRADDLAKSLDNDYQSFKKVIEESQKGIATQLFNKGVDPQLGNDMNNQLANIRTLARQQRAELAKGNQDSADDLGRKLRAAQEKALSFADSETSKRNGMVGMGTVRQSTYANTYGDQSLNFDTINAFKDLVSSQVDTADEQKRNTGDQGRAKALEEANKAQAELLKSMEEGLAKQKAQYGVSVAAELAYWSARISAFSRGSEQYHTVQMDQYRLQAELYTQLMEGKKRYLADSKGDVEGNDLAAAGAEAFAKINLEQMERASKAAREYATEVARGAEIQQKSATAFAEASIEMAVLQGTMSRLEAAQALAAVHAQDHAEAIERVNKALAEQISLINSDPKLTDEDKAGAIRNATQTAANQRGALNGDFSITRQRDQQAIAGQQLGPATKQALGTMVNDWENMTQGIIQAMTRAMDGFNEQIVNAITGKKTDFAKVFSEAGSSLLKTTLQSAEGHVMGAFGLGKPDGTATNPIHTIEVGGVGAGGLGGLTGTGTFRPFFGGHPTIGGGQTGGGGGGGILNSLFHSFFGKSAAGGGVSGDAGAGLGDIGIFGNGGNFMANHPMIVGDRGPELMTPGFSGHITPNNGAGDTHVYHIDARGSNDPMAVHAAVARALPHAVSASMQASHQSKMRSPGKR